MKRLKGVSPEALIAVLLDEISGRLEEIYERMEWAPQGILDDYTISVTDEYKTLEGGPWFSFTLFNDGPNDVYVYVNDYKPVRETPLRSGDSINIDMQQPLIEKIILICNPGETASVRIFAKR